MCLLKNEWLPRSMVKSLTGFQPVSRESIIKEQVRMQIEEAGQRGRFVLTSSNSIQSGVKPENYLAMLDALDEYGADI